MRPSIPLFALMLLLVSGGSAMAKGRAETPGFVDDIDARCQLWAPSMLGPHDYAVRYTGACKNGRAEGKGKAEWLYRFAEMKVKSAWEGEFRNGVFLAGQTIKGSVEPVRGDRYVVDMGMLSSANVFFISRSAQDGPMELCRVDQIAIVPAPGFALADDEQAKRIMSEGAKTYREACPDGQRDVRLGIFAEPVKARANGMLPNAVASARLDAGNGNLTGYSNEASAKARQEKQQAEYAARQEEMRRLFNEFNLKNGISAWVTADQLDENPFRWEGQTVGLVVRLDRMLARDTALVRSGLRDWGRHLQLSGIAPDFPESRRSVLLAATVGKRQPLVDASDNNSATYTTLRQVDHRLCERDACAEWFIWARGDRELVWGQPYNAR